MHVADVLVQNAGGLSLTEALVAGLPAVTYRPIPGHGRANAAVLDASGLAPWARTDDQLVEFVHAARDGTERRPSSPIRRHWCSRSRRRRCAPGRVA